MFQTNVVEEFKTHFLVFSNSAPSPSPTPAPKIVMFMRCGKITYCGAGHRWHYGAFALHAGYLRLQTHTHAQFVYYSSLSHDNGCTKASPMVCYTYISFLVSLIGNANLRYQTGVALLTCSCRLEIVSRCQLLTEQKHYFSENNGTTYGNVYNDDDDDASVCGILRLVSDSEWINKILAQEHKRMFLERAVTGCNHIPWPSFARRKTPQLLKSLIAHPSERHEAAMLVNVSDSTSQL